MDENLWTDRKKNNGRNSYWKFFDGKKLSQEEKSIRTFIDGLEDRYINIDPERKNKKGVEEIKASMIKARPDILEALTRCCILTYVFVPIEKIVVGDWKRDFSYEQRFAMWRGADFKGIYAYGKPFVDEALDRDVLICPNLLELHLQMQVKGFSVADVYDDSMRESNGNPEKISIWNSKNPQAKDFVKSYLNSELRSSISRNNALKVAGPSNNLIDSILRSEGVHHI